jgi:uracil DNA glycosylase
LGYTRCVVVKYYADCLKTRANIKWNVFTDAVIQKISEEEACCVFCCGEVLPIKGLKIDRNKHLVLESGHPSPLSIIKESGLVISILVKQMCT